MHKMSMAAMSAVAVAFNLLDSGVSAATDLREVVDTIRHPGAKCFDHRDGMRVACFAGSPSGQLVVYVREDAPNTLAIDLKLSASANMATMTMYFDYMREATGKLGLTGNAYQQCTDIGASLNVTNHFVRDYAVECRTYARLSILNAELRFTSR